MTQVNPTLVRSVPLGKDGGTFFDVPLHELLPPEVIAIAVNPGEDGKRKLLRDLLLVGTSRIFVDVQASAKNMAERKGACDKKLDAWRNGEMNVRGGGGGGETIEGEAKRLIIAAYMARTGESETKAALKFKGRGFDVLMAIANAKAAAMLAADMPDEPDAKASEGQKAAYTAALEAHNARVAAEANRLFEAAKASWSAKAEASLKAKAEARQASDKMDVAALLDPDGE